MAQGEETMLPSEQELKNEFLGNFLAIMQKPEEIDSAVQAARLVVSKKDETALSLKQIEALFDSEGNIAKQNTNAEETLFTTRLSDGSAEVTVDFRSCIEPKACFAGGVSDREKMVITAVRHAAIERLKEKYNSLGLTDYENRLISKVDTVLDESLAQQIGLSNPKSTTLSVSAQESIAKNIETERASIELAKRLRKFPIYQQHVDKLRLEFLKMYLEVATNPQEIDKALIARESVRLTSGTKAPYLDLSKINELGVFDASGCEKTSQGIKVDSRAYIVRPYYSSFISQRESLVLDAISAEVKYRLMHNHQQEMESLLHGDVGETNFDAYKAALSDAANVLNKFKDAKLCSVMGNKPSEAFLAQVKQEISRLEQMSSPLAATKGSSGLFNKIGFISTVGLGLSGAAIAAVGAGLALTGIGTIPGFALLSFGGAMSMTGMGLSLYFGARLIIQKLSVKPEHEQLLPNKNSSTSKIYRTFGKPDLTTNEPGHKAAVLPAIPVTDISAAKQRAEKRKQVEQVDVMQKSSTQSISDDSAPRRCVP